MTTDIRVPVAGVFRDVTGKPFNADREAIRTLNRMMDRGDHLSVRLPIARLNATQPGVHPGFKRVRERYSGAIDADPAVVKYQGSYYLVDGHHRTMDAAARGETTIRVRLFDLDLDTQLDFPLLDGLEPEEGISMGPGMR